jgi:hypothetical protein
MGRDRRRAETTMEQGNLLDYRFRALTYRMTRFLGADDRIVWPASYLIRRSFVETGEEH